MSTEIIIPIAALVIILLIIAWLFKVIKASIKTILTIAAILIGLQLAFGINSKQLIQEVLQIVERLPQFIFN